MANSKATGNQLFRLNLLGMLPGNEGRVMSYAEADALLQRAVAEGKWAPKRTSEE